MKKLTAVSVDNDIYVYEQGSDPYGAHVIEAPIQQLLNKQQYYLDNVATYTTLTASFVQPVVGAGDATSDVVVELKSNAWMILGQTVAVAAGGYYTVQAINPGGAVATLRCLSGVAQGSTVPSSGLVEPCGPTGVAGAAGPTGPTGPSQDWVPLTAATWTPTPAAGNQITTSYDYRNLLLPGTPLRWVNEIGVEVEDASARITASNGLAGHTSLIDGYGQLYFALIDDTGGYYHVDVYSHSDATGLIAHTASYNATGIKALVADNASGVTGTVTIDTLGTGTAIMRYLNYAIVTDVTATSVTTRGETFYDPVTSLCRGPRSHVAQVTIPIPGAFATASTTLYKDTHGIEGIPWGGPPAHCVAVVAKASAVAVAYAYVNVLVDGRRVSTATGSDGILLDTAYEHSTAYDINYDNLVIPGSVFELATTTGAAGNTNLRALALLVLI